MRDQVETPRRDPRRVARDVVRFVVAMTISLVLFTFSPPLVGLAILGLIVTAALRPASRARGILPIATGMGLMLIPYLALALLRR